MSHYPPDVYRYFRVKKFWWRLRRGGVSRSLRMAWRRVQRPAWMMGWLLWVAGCTISAIDAPTSTPTPIPTATPSLPAGDGWTNLAPGLDRRVYNPSAGFFARLTVLRIDPAQYDFRVHYRPGDPQMIDEWADQLPMASVIFNTNFFDREDRITGILFADGQRYGDDPYQRRGGTFYMQSGVPGIQSNLVQPYNGEQYDQAVQAFPMLMTDGQQSYFDTRPDRASRRTVIGVDEWGRVLVMVTSFSGLTLLDLAEYLPTTDMNITDALNLDGGGSTMLAVRAGETVQTVESFDPVPAIMAIYPR